MSWDFVGIVVSLDITVISIHILAVTLLVKLKQHNVKGSQKVLLIALCVTELTYALIDILDHVCYKLELDPRTFVFFVLNSTTVTFMYIFIMTCIVVDRFFEIYLNIKYRVLWSSKKTKMVLLIGLIICCILFVPFIIMELKNRYITGDTLSRYIYPVIELVFIIIFSWSYFYIIRQVLRYRINTKTLEKQLSRNSRVVYHKQFNNQFKLFVPTLIIVTFLLFMIGPSILRLFVALKLLNGDVGYRISFVLVPVGFIADPIIYIFSLKAIRSAFKRVLPSNNSVHNRVSLFMRCLHNVRSVRYVASQSILTKEIKKPFRISR